MDFCTDDVCWNHVKGKRVSMNTQKHIQNTHTANLYTHTRNEITEKCFHFHTLAPKHARPDFYCFLLRSVDGKLSAFRICKKGFYYANYLPKWRLIFLLSRSPSLFARLLAWCWWCCCWGGDGSDASLTRFHVIWIIIIKWLWLPQFIYFFFLFFLRSFTTHAALWFMLL